MAIAFVQNLGAYAPATTMTAAVTLASGVNTTGQNTVILRAHSTAGNNVTAVTDTKGNIWVNALFSTAADATIEIWYALMTRPLLAGDTITATWQSSVAGTGATADEFSGLATSGPVDVELEATTASGTSVTVGPTAATTVANELIFSAAGASTTGTWTYPTGYTTLATPGGTVAYQGAYKIVSSTGTQTATWVNGSAADIDGCIVTFKAQPVTFGPLFPVPVVVELLIAGTWIDVSQYVYQRDGISITGGNTPSPATSSSTGTSTADTFSGITGTSLPQPAQATFTLNNRDGRFTPTYTNGAYYPNLQRNTRVRISIQGAQSTSGNTYSGYRFWGEVPDWPPLQDISGRDVYEQITATGPLRRIRAGGGKGSALTRYYNTLTGSFAPVAYWPCEEDPDTDVLSAGIDGGSNMTITTVASYPGGPGQPHFMRINSINGSAPVPVINYSTWDGQTASFGTSGNDVFSVPGTYQWQASTATVDARVWGAGGGGSNGVNGCAGGGGGFAETTTLAVTPGTMYNLTVGAGGQPGDGSKINNTGSAGAASIMNGDAGATVKAGGGHGGGKTAGGTGGAGISGGTQHTGGSGGSNPGDWSGGAGGGGAAGTTANGSNGGNGFSQSGAAGGNGGSVGGGKGGNGGNGFHSPTAGFPGAGPGGGGGGGGLNVGTLYGWAGGGGAAGEVNLIYSANQPPSVNVIRFIVFVPHHGGNNGKVVLKAFTGAANLHHINFTYGTGGKFRAQGFTSGNVSTFDTGLQSWNMDGLAVMVSLELVNSGTGVNWALRGIQPGQPNLIAAAATGTLASTQVGSVSEITVAPNADISKTSVSHISVQYALISLRQLSRRLDGHNGEVSIDRLIRLANEQALDQFTVEFHETSDHWGFEPGTQSWVAANSTIAQSAATFTPAVTDTCDLYSSWPADGTRSLLVTASGGAGQWNASSPAPSGGVGLNVQVGDMVHAACEVYTPAALGAMQIAINWYTSGNVLISTTSSTALATSAGEIATLNVSGTAPATAAFFSITVADNETKPVNTVFYVDNVRVSPKMGPQTRKFYHQFLEEIKDLDQGILKESRRLFGLGFRTRIGLINQASVITLDYNAGTIGPIGGSGGQAGLAPVFDDRKLANDITVYRHKGSKVHFTLASGTVSVQEPPGGSGRYKKHLKMVAWTDAQLSAIVQHLLNLGTVITEDYPNVSIDLARANVPGNAVAPLMSAIAGVEMGDFITITNLPFWYPQATAKQLVIGYTENINAYTWNITWNCEAESPWEIIGTNLRRW
jgi:hypothetical protein